MTRRRTARAPPPHRYKTVPALAAYIERIASGREVERRNFRRFAIREGGEHFTIGLKRDGTVLAPEEHKPSDHEQKAIRAAIARSELPRSIKILKPAAEWQGTMLGVDDDHWFVFLDASRREAIMGQQWIGKVCVPWAFFNSEGWLPLEPDGDLPLWKPEKRRMCDRIMIHRGAKAARCVDRLVNDVGLKADEARERHPWSRALSLYEHFGWIGADHRPSATDWTEVAKENPNQIVFACDEASIEAARAISRALDLVKFDERFAAGFALTDDLPAAFWEGAKYIGPSLADLIVTATWSSGPGRPSHEKEFAADCRHRGTWRPSYSSAAYEKARYLAEARGGNVEDFLEEDAANLDVIALALGGEIEGRTIVAPSPGRPMTDRSLVVIIDRARPHDFYIYGCEGSLGAARTFVAEKLKLVVPTPGAADERTAVALRLLNETVPAPGTLVETYLRSRSIDIRPPAVLRFHPRLRHGPTKSVWPAMVAVVTTVVEKPVAIHRTWLRHDGSGKAPVEPDKMTLGPIRGNAIRLAPHTDEVLVGEGIETCLSVTVATGRPSWSAISATGLRSLELPAAISTVTILADGEDVGEAAALAAAVRWRGEGRKVRIARPPRGFDFNDVLTGKVSP